MVTCLDCLEFALVIIIVRDFIIGAKRICAFDGWGSLKS